MRISFAERRFRTTFKAFTVQSSRFTKGIEGPTPQASLRQAIGFGLPRRAAEEYAAITFGLERERLETGGIRRSYHL
jgi:hypothetical protein